jgi:hypothetical protein
MGDVEDGIEGELARRQSRRWAAVSLREKDINEEGREEKRQWKGIGGGGGMVLTRKVSTAVGGGAASKAAKWARGGMSAGGEGRLMAGQNFCQKRGRGRGSALLQASYRPRHR